TVNSDTSITAVSPSGTGTVDVTVTTPGGTSSTTAVDQFSYSAAGQIDFRGKSTLSSGQRTSSCKVPKPAGVVPGDQMLLQIYVEDPEAKGSFTIASSGWALVEKVDNKSSGIWFALAVFTKTYEAGDPTEYTVTWSGTAKRGCGALAAAWSGVSKDAPINAHLGAASAGASATVRGASGTTTTADCMIVMLGDYNATDTRTAPPGMEDVAGPEGIIAQVLQPEVKATGNKDAKTGKAEGNVGVLVALAPAEGEPPPPPVPTIANVNPGAGPAAGGTSVTITGTNLSGATAVKFGTANPASFTVNSDTSITAVSPSGTGTVDVTVTTPGGTSSTTAVDQFSYSAAAQIAFRGKSTLSYGQRTSSSKAPNPAGVVPGDQMLLQIYVEDPEAKGSFTIASSGWALVEKVDNKS